MTTRTFRRPTLPELAILAGQVEVTEETAGEELAAASHPVRLIKRGQDLGVAMSAEAFATLQDEIERLELLVRTLLATEEAAAGRVVSSEEALALVRRKLAEKR